MSTAQHLLRRLIDLSGGAFDTGYVLVIDGEGLEHLPEQILTTMGSCGVHRVSTELGLRHLLWKANGAPLIAVMPEEVARRVHQAPDLLGGARNGRVLTLSALDVIEVVLGVRVVGVDADYLQKLALEYLSTLEHDFSRRTLPTVVDRRLLTELLVDASVGEQVRTQPPAQLVAEWFRKPPQWSNGVTELMIRELPSLHGDEGRLIAWALSEPATRLAELIVHGALLTVEAQDLPQSVWGPLWNAATAAPIEMDRRIARRTVARLAQETLILLGDDAHALLERANRIGRQNIPPKDLQTSRLLPLAFEERCHSLAHGAAKRKPISASDIAWLADHRAAPMFPVDLKVLKAMGRLSRYLDQPHTVKAELLDQVRDYLREGAFADLAMTQLRRALASSARYHAEAKDVLSACRERRDRENQRFAETLAGGYEASLYRQGVTPLHRIWKRTVAELWQKEPDAPLFLVVLDGCSYPVFLELLAKLSQDSTLPLGIKPHDDRVWGFPALSPLPTVTSHARGAIFLGELPNDPLVAETVFRDQEEAKTDKARFNQNAALGSRSRRLFLKGDLTDGGQGLLAALGDPSISVVAAVFNAVDDQIGSSNTGATMELAPEQIAAFKPALHSAVRSGRRVLVTADHGHSPYIDKSLRAGNGKMPRYLPLEKHETAPDGFIEIDLAGLGGPPERRAFAWRSGAYLGGPQVGFHGGCSLEEVVVPLAWIERDGLRADEPAWWYGRGIVAENTVQTGVESRDVAPPPSAPAPASQPVEKAKAQLSLFEPGDRAGTLPLPSDLRDRLSADDKTVLVLLRENGTARAGELAERVNKTPGRLTGYMRTLHRTLYEGGHVLFTTETLPSGETMYRYQGKEKL